MQDHNKILKELTAHFKPILDNSTDGVYLWLDEKHMICNEKLAKMFGYKNAQELCKVSPFLDKFVAEKDQMKFARNYQETIGNLSSPVTFKFTAVKKDKKTFQAETIMIPITFMGHAIAYHFVRMAKK